MLNLAGSPDADRIIGDELKRARIRSVFSHIPSDGEVKTHLTGEMGQFKFTRAWSYWVVRGYVPIDIAQTLYDDPVGRTDIRVEGHCACPSPTDDDECWVTRVTPEGKIVCPDEEYDKIQVVENGLIWTERRVACFRLEYVRASEAPMYSRYIKQYHIDSEVGLRIFADAIRDLRVA